MKAVLLTKPEEIAIVEVPRQDDPSKVVIRLEAAGICGSDISAYKGTSPLVSYPRIIGHELAGEVISVPAGVTHVKPGDRVVAEPYVYCGTCRTCKMKRTNCCENLTVSGVHIDGGMVEYFSHPSHLVHLVPDNMTWEQAALVEPLTISLHGLNRAQVKAGENVVITGAGTIGLLAALAAKGLGATPILVDPTQERLDLAGKMGITHLINPTKVDAIEEISKITHGTMADVVIEAAGAAVAVKNAIDYVAYAGRISLVGYPIGDVPIPTFLITKKELTVLGSRNSAQEFPQAIELLSSGKVNADQVVSHRITFDELPEYVIRIAKNPGEFLKVIARL